MNPHEGDPHQNAPHQDAPHQNASRAEAAHEDEALWRNRFILINLARIGATVVVLLGLALWQSDLFVEGGSFLGFPITIVALALSFMGPKWLARRWRSDPPGPPPKMR